ncbi:MAG: SufB/SufD family protein [Thiobacillaceae bacterium]
MADLTALYQAFNQIGEDPGVILAADTAHLVAYGHQVISRQSVPGVTVEAHTDEKGVHARVTVAEGRVIMQPVHLCFGLFERFGVQNVDLTLELAAGAVATFWSHCLFMFPDMARHAMDARVELQAGARLTYNEVHYHGLSGGLEVLARARVKLGEAALYRADFSLTQGRVGRLKVDYDVDVGAAASAELTSRVYGHLGDEIDLREVLRLNGAHARGLVKSRVAVEDEARARVVGATHGNAAGARGHVDCLEIVRGNARASAVPEVEVTHPEAQVTHEAAIGSVDRRQLETLMARGLAPDDAVDRIILGMLG